MQFFLYLIVGGLSFFMDIGTFVALRTIEVPIILGSTSFILATVVNYFLSRILAFEGGRFHRPIEMLRFLTVVLIGLGLNTYWCGALSIHFQFSQLWRRLPPSLSCWFGTILGGAYSYSATNYRLRYAPG